MTNIMLPKRFKRGPSTALVVGAFFLLFGVGFLVAAWGAYSTDTNIQRSGLIAEGQLEKKLFMEVADGDSDYILEYWFKPQQGATIKASRNVSEALWDSVHEGQTIQIKYSASNPKRNFPAGAGATSIAVAIFASVIAALLAILGGALIWGYFHSATTT